MNNRIRRLGVLGCLLLLLTGCGGPKYQTAPVSGRVTLDGRPMANAHVSFQPTAQGNPNPGPGSFGVTDADGHFRLQTIQPRQDGAVVGSHVVRIVPYRPNEGLKDDDTVRPRDPSLPPQADDGSLRFAVSPDGTDRADFALTSKPATRQPASGL
jgi:hypothetical protein